MKFEWKTCFRVGIYAFLFYLAVHYWPAWSQMAVLLAGAAKTLFIGGVIAYLVNILMSTYERHYFINSKNPAIQKSRRAVCMTAAFLTLLGIVCLLIKMVIPELISCASILAKELPTVLERGGVLLEKNESLSLVIAENLEPAITALDWKEFLSKALKLFTAGFGGMLGAVLQQLEGNLIYPKEVGSSIGLPGLWVLAAVTVGGGIFGIAGMLVGVPLAATLYQLLRMDMARKEY